MPDPYGGFHGSPADAQLLMTLCLALWVFLTFVAILIGWGDIDLYRQFDAPPNFWVLSLVAVWVGLLVPEFRI
jgi:hypothetical protein